MLALRKEFEVLTMRECEAVDEYFAIVFAAANCMTAHGETTENVLVVEKILKSLTSKFNHVVC